MDYKDTEIDFLREKCRLQERLIAEYEISNNAINSVVDRALRFPYKYEQAAKEIELKAETKDSK